MIIGLMGFVATVLVLACVIVFFWDVLKALIKGDDSQPPTLPGA